MAGETLLDLARAGNEEAFARLSEPHRHELTLHCYRMLGSPQDAEDMVQETLLRAWQRLATYEPRAPFRAWLYKIATNACLDALRRRPARVFGLSDAAAADEEDWLQPLPGTWLDGTPDDPEAVYSHRESVSLAFMTVLQQLAPRARAVLLLRDVLGWRAREVADYLEMSEAAVNSLLLRAREALHSAPPPAEPSLPLLERYLQAWENADIAAFTAFLKEDALLTMPPLPLVLRGRAAILHFLRMDTLGAGQTWRLVATRANGQPSFALYRRAEGDDFYTLFCLQVLRVEGEQVAEIHNFLAAISPATTPVARWLRFFDMPLTPPVVT